MNTDCLHLRKWLCLRLGFQHPDALYFEMARSLLRYQQVLTPHAILMRLKKGFKSSSYA